MIRKRKRLDKTGWDRRRLVNTVQDSTITILDQTGQDLVCTVKEDWTILDKTTRLDKNRKDWTRLVRIKEDWTMLDKT